MKPTDELRHEHEVILHMLSGAERIARSAINSGDVDIGKVLNIIDFSRHFIDGCHHNKEEKYLFTLLQERGITGRQGPIAVMLFDHQRGRDLVASIDSALKEYQAGKKEAGGVVGRSLLQYVGILRAHISKENEILFPMTDRLLTAEDQESLESSFRDVEELETGAGVHEKYHRMAHEIGA